MQAIIFAPSAGLARTLQQATRPIQPPAFVLAAGGK